MSDTPEEIAKRRQAFAELIRLSEEAGLYDLEEPTPDEIVATVKQVRKELAEERRAKGEKNNESTGTTQGR